MKLYPTNELYENGRFAALSTEPTGQSAIDVEESVWKTGIELPGQSLVFRLSDRTVVTVSDHELLNLSTYKSSAIKKVNRECREKIESGFLSSALGSPHHYGLKLHDQQNLSDQQAFSSITNEPQLFKCTNSEGDEEYRPHSPDQLLEVSGNAQVHKLNLLLAKHEKVMQIKAASSHQRIKELLNE